MQLLCVWTLIRGWCLLADLAMFHSLRPYQIRTIFCLYTLHGFSYKPALHLTHITLYCNCHSKYCKRLWKYKH